MNSFFLEVRIKKQLHSFQLYQEFSLRPQQSLALLGASGSGKSMTLRLLSGLVQPDEGQILLNHRLLFDSKQRTNVPSREREIGLVFQNYALFPHMTVAQNIRYGIPKPLTQLERQEAVRQLLAEVRLESLADRYPAQLSGGQQQRVALARALAARPRLLLLDEPFSALDSALKSELEELLLRFREVHQIPYILVTHNLEEAYRLCDEIAVMDNGTLLQKGPKDVMLNAPQTPEVAHKMGARNLWRGEITDQEGEIATVWIPGLSLQLKVHSLAASKKVWIGIRPSEAILWTEAAPELPNTFPVKIIREVRGVQSHTLFAGPYASEIDDSRLFPPGGQDTELLDTELIEVEVPNYRLKSGPYFLSLPLEKLFLLEA